MSPVRPRQGKLFYGWWVVLSAATGLLLGYAPMVVFPFGVFVKSLVQDFHSNRTEISFAFTLANIMVSFSSPLAGRLVDRFGARRVVLPSTLILGVLLVCFQFVTGSLWQLYVLFLALGFVGSGTAPVPYCKVVSTWFDRQRGLALGLTMAGIGIGAMFMPTIAQRLISHVGWRSTYAIMGFATLILAIPIVALLLRNNPEDLGLFPDGVVDSRTRGERNSVKTGLTWRAARSSGTFWLMAGAFSLAGASVHACVIHLVSLLSDRGIRADHAALASSTLGIALLFGRVGSGYVLDRFFAPYVAVFFFSGVACGLFLLWIGAGGATVFLAAFLIGLGMGAEGDLIAYLTSRYFGLLSFGEIYGYLFSAFTLAGALGPLLMAKGYDRTGSYQMPLLLFLMATIAATLVMTRLGPYRYRPA